jgi:hypothetical protein
MEKSSASRTSYPLRISDDMREALEKAANANRRSLHAEIVARLHDSLIPDAINFEFAQITEEQHERYLSAQKLYKKLADLHQDVIRMALNMLDDAVRTMRRHKVPEGEVKHIEATRIDLANMAKRLKEDDK